jgi:predicted NBD/HSP70 family sugar kinase
MTDARQATPTGAGRALALLHAAGGEVRRTSLTRDLGLTRASVGEVLAGLMNLGVVTVATADPETGRAGRPSPAVRISADAPWGAAVSVEAGAVLCGYVRLGGQIAATSSTTFGAKTRPDEVAGLISGELERLLRTTDGRCVGATIAVPGLVSANDGRLLSATPLGWSDVPVAALVRARLGADVPIAVANDANLAARAEQRWGAGRGSSHLLYVTSGRVGIGGALVIEGRVFDGASGLALELGHVPVSGGRERCECGAVGCLNVEADARALARLAGEPVRTAAQAVRVSARVLERELTGEQAAVRAVDRAAERLASGLAAAINMVDPDVVVLAGLPAALAERRADGITGSIATASIVARASGVMVSSATQDQPVLIGAGDDALEPLFRDPRRALASEAVRSAETTEVRGRR